MLGHDVVRHADGTHAAYPATHLGAVCLPQPFLGDGAGGNAADGLPGRRAAAARRGPRTHLDLVREIRVSGTRHRVHLLVVPRPLILVFHHQAYGRAEGVAALGAREDGYKVFLVARRRQPALAGAAARELRLDVRLGELHARRHAIHNCPDSLAVRLTESRDTEDASEGRHGPRTRARNGRPSAREADAARMSLIRSHRLGARTA
mmetsp:Transcript_13891/g.37815  ORF Transcript_13891/g.37815 Transcript_13891/m.37815 type:complete len:206 (-) Transcript_13891:3-620(-)